MTLYEVLDNRFLNTHLDGELTAEELLQVREAFNIAIPALWRGMMRAIHIERGLA